jgi:hypothetical protein
MKRIRETRRWKLHLFWYLTYTYFQNEHVLNSLAAKLKNLLSGIEDKFYEKKWSRVEVRKPIFIVAPHRTGTTILQQALSFHSAIATPRTYSDVFDMFPILAERFLRPLFPGFSDRMVDRIVVGRDTPQEAQGIVSRYFAKDFVAYNPTRAEDLFRYMRKLLYLDRGTRFLWKAPSLTRDLPEIAALFPDSQFIYIHRDPLVAVASKMKFIRIWQQLAFPASILYCHLVGKPSRKGKPALGHFMDQANRTVNLIRGRPDRRKMTEDHLRCMENALTDLSALHDPGRCCYLDYQVLVDRPRDSLQKLLAFLGLPDETGPILDRMQEIGMPLREPEPSLGFLSGPDLEEVRRTCRGRVQKMGRTINNRNWRLIGAAPSASPPAGGAGKKPRARSRSPRR